MSNCDWGRPCDCRDCCEITESFTCPSCQFKNKVSIARTARWVDDKKHGGGGYDFDIPTSPIKDLDCYNCGYRMEKVGYYTSVDTDACKRQKERDDRIRAGRFCVNCNKVEEIDLNSLGFSGSVKLHDMNGRILCEVCLSDAIKQETSDPSDLSNKYLYDRRKMVWKLDKIKRPCATCGKQRWINAENHWKTQCISCYQSSIRI